RRRPVSCRSREGRLQPVCLALGAAASDETEDEHRDPDEGQEGTKTERWERSRDELPGGIGIALAKAGEDVEALHVEVDHRCYPDRISYEEEDQAPNDQPTSPSSLGGDVPQVALPIVVRLVTRDVVDIANLVPHLVVDGRRLRIRLMHAALREDELCVPNP